MNNFLKMFKDSKNLKYAVNVFVLLVIISIILNIDTSKITGGSSQVKASYQNEADSDLDSYVKSLEKRLEEILGKIENMESVDVMIYTKNTPSMEPVRNENSSNETNVEVGSDGTKREVNKETRQSQVIVGNDNKVVEKYYQYPEITGVLVVANYKGSKDIYAVLMDSVKTLLDIKMNDIEIILSGRN